MTKNSYGYNQYTKEETLLLVKDWYEKTGKIVIRDLRHKNGLPSVAQVINMFGSFQNCLKEAGISISDREYCFNRECFTDKEMLDNYKKFVIEHLKTHNYLPTNNDVDNCSYIQSASVYQNRFGSFKKINELIGYNQLDFNNIALERDMLFKYKRACEEYGHTLNSREITQLSKEKGNFIYSTEAYLNHFGSLHNLQEICGYDKTVPGKGADREELVRKLQWLGKELGRRPTQTDLKLFKNMPSCNTYLNAFGSFKIALNESGFEKQRILKTKNGVKVNSTYELKLAQVLESYGICYRNEIPYKDIVPNFKRNYRFDFQILFNGNIYYIELFGIEGNELYEKRKQEKISTCLKYNIPLIQMYQNDIYSKTNQEIYNILLQKTNEIKKIA